MKTKPKEKKFIAFSRLLWLFILLAVIIVVTLLFLLDHDDMLLLLEFIPLFAFGGAVALAMFVTSLAMSCKEYRYNDNDILVYSGFFHNYIKVNGEKYDEHNTFMNSCSMSCTLDDGAEVEVVVSFPNRISLKINGRLQTKI